MTNSRDLNESQESFDARRIAEDVAAGEQQMPTVNVDRDYEASKAFSTSPVDQTDTGREQAEAATAPQFPVRTSEVPVSSPEASGDPEAFRDLAREVNPRGETEQVATQDLMQKAMEKGQPGK